MIMDTGMIVYGTTDIIDNRKNSKRKPEEQKQEEQIKYLKEAEIIKLLINIPNELHSLLYQFLFETAGRCSEVLSVKLSDIDMYNKTVKLITLKKRKGEHGKSKPPVYRVLTLSDALITKILLYEKRLKLSGQDYLFTRKARTEHISVQAVNQAMKKYVPGILGAEYKKYGHPHVFRHSRAVQLLNSGKVDIVKLQRILGHANIQNTLIYLQFSNKDIQESVRNANAQIGLI